MGLLTGGGFGQSKQTTVPLTVSAQNSTQDNVRGASPCYAGVSFKTDNKSYISGIAGNYTTVLDNAVVSGGSMSEVWVSRVINSGALQFDGIGAGRQQLGVAPRTVECTDTNSSAASSSSCNLTLTFWDAPTGGNQLDTAVYDLTANYDTS